MFMSKCYIIYIVLIIDVKMVCKWAHFLMKILMTEDVKTFCTWALGVSVLSLIQTVPRAGSPLDKKKNVVLQQQA